MTESTAPRQGHERRAPDPRRRSQRAHTAILEAAAELLGEIGFSKMTIEGIAARARVGKQTIYRWWPSKSAVLLDVFTTYTGSEAGEPLPDTGDVETDLKTVFRAIVDEFNTPSLDRTARAFTAEIQHDPQLAREITDRLLLPNLEAFKQRLRAAQEAGQVSPDADLDMAVELLNGPLHYRWLMRLAPLTHAYADGLVDTALRALRP